MGDQPTVIVGIPNQKETVRHHTSSIMIVIYPVVTLPYVNESQQTLNILFIIKIPDSFVYCQQLILDT